ncbi:hypothetical protein EGW08_006576, partial [Elysia chlorotica]
MNIARNKFAQLNTPGQLVSFHKIGNVIMGVKFDEYLTAPMEVVTSEGDDVHNISGSLSENSTWDNYQMVYPTASEDANEELLAWEPHDDDLEFDDDFQLARQRSRSIVTDVLKNGQQRGTKLKFTKQGVPCEDSDSDLEDFHYILDQSELQLKLVDQSLRKKRRDPMGTGLHPNPGKYVCASRE